MRGLKCRLSLRFGRRGLPLLSMPPLMWFLCKAGPERFFFNILKNSLIFFYGGECSLMKGKDVYHVFMHKLLYDIMRDTLDGELTFASNFSPYNPYTSSSSTTTTTPVTNSIIFFGMLCGIVLPCKPLLELCLVSEDPFPVSRSLQVGGIMLYYLQNLKVSGCTLYNRVAGHPLI